MMQLLKQKYPDPEDLPYHIIVPSLMGYTFSDAPPLDRDWKIADTARVMHKLMLSLGFGEGEKGYVVQGGDIGSFIARTIAATYTECKGMHLNMMFMHPPADASALEPQLSDEEKRGLEVYKKFQETGNAYGRMHGTRPATIGHALSSSPLALLSWIGEKFLTWVDTRTPLPLDTILADVTLYWLTGCFPTSIYTYREDFSSKDPGYFHAQEHLFVDKPFGYSYFPAEITPVPRSWAERTGRLVWFREHEGGGHFAALERPGELWADVEGFVGEVWER
jgi:microsomal epoxide hydrolase